MRTETVAAVSRLPQERVFAFMSKIENLPRWATEFCRGLERRSERWVVISPMGEMLFEIQADARTGVVDMTSGPSEAQLMTWPARVVALPGGGSAFLFTALQQPGLETAAFEAQLASLRRELAELPALLERAA